MNHDMSDEAFWEWDQENDRLHWDQSFSEHALNGWQECRRRAQGNRWKLFDTPELWHFCDTIYDAGTGNIAVGACDQCAKWLEEIRAELKTRGEKVDNP